MDLFTASTTLATLVGLIANFKQEREVAASASREEFMAYLEHRRHTELKDLITRTHELSHEVDNFLREDHAVIIEKLNTVNSLLAALLSKIDGLGGITDVLAPQFKLSDQAFAILAAFVDSGSSLMSEMRMHGFVFLNLHSGGQISADDQRFLQDDFDTLCALGFIVKERSSRDAPYRLTRSAQQFVSASRASSTRATA